MPPVRVPVVLFNPPNAARPKPLLPLSLLSLGAVIGDIAHWGIVDGNIEADPLGALERAITDMNAGVLGMTVMPGPQLGQAIALSRTLKARHPHLLIVWGGYFRPSTGTLPFGRRMSMSWFVGTESTSSTTCSVASARGSRSTICRVSPTVTRQTANLARMRSRQSPTRTRCPIFRMTGLTSGVMSAERCSARERCRTTPAMDAPSCATSVLS